MGYGVRFSSFLLEVMEDYSVAYGFGLESSLHRSVLTAFIRSVHCHHQRRRHHTGYFYNTEQLIYIACNIIREFNSHESPDLFPSPVLYF